MEELKFNSQICTTIEQSNKLLELGLKPETADMSISTQSFDTDNGIKYSLIPYSECKYRIMYNIIPAWYLHRLIDLCTEYINIDGYPDTTYWFTMHKLDNKIIYENDYNRWLYLGDGDNLFDTLIDCIEWLIKEGHFNKDYIK